MLFCTRAVLHNNQTAQNCFKMTDLLRTVRPICESHTRTLLKVGHKLAAHCSDPDLLQLLSTHCWGPASSITSLTESITLVSWTDPLSSSTPTTCFLTVCKTTQPRESVLSAQTARKPERGHGSSRLLGLFAAHWSYTVEVCSSEKHIRRLFIQGVK